MKRVKEALPRGNRSFWVEIITCHSTYNKNEIRSIMTARDFDNAQLQYTILIQCTGLRSYCAQFELYAQVFLCTDIVQDLKFMHSFILCTVIVHKLNSAKFEPYAQVYYVHDLSHMHRFIQSMV